MQVNPLFDQVAHMLANGEANSTDVVALLDGLNAFVESYQPEIAKWMPTSFRDMEEQYVKAEKLSQPEEV